MSEEDDEDESANLLHPSEQDTPFKHKMATIDRNTFKPSYFAQFFTRELALACGLVAISTFNYAFDQQGFNSTQAMDSFNRTFGYYKNDEDGWVLPTYYLSLLNSLVYIGFATGKYVLPFPIQCAHHDQVPSSVA